MQSHQAVNADEKFQSSASRLAKTLETLLFSRSKSAEDYTNPEQMNKSLQSLVETLKNRRQKAKDSSVLSAGMVPLSLSGTTRMRQEFLRKILGQEKHGQIKRLVQEIKLARLEMVGERCTQCRRQEDGTMVCPMPSTTSSSSNSFPPAVKRLFFKVDLIHALEFQSLQTWRSTDWEVLLIEAQEILDNYREWRKLGR